MSYLIDPTKDLEMLAEKLRSRARRTPDYKEMKSKKHILVFVYGSLMKGGFLNETLKDSKFLYAAETGSSSFIMKDLGSFPGLIRSRSPGSGYKIFGEVYDIDALTLTDLDGIESNGRFYQRCQICVVNLMGEPRTVWVYLLKEPDHYRATPLVPHISGTQSWCYKTSDRPYYKRFVQ